MTHCAKCGAELIGSRKFCAACGTPAGDPRSPAASTGLQPGAAGRTPSAPGSAPNSEPSIQYAPSPVSQVNPFAQTAGPGTRVPSDSNYGPPPAPISVSPELATTAPGMGDPNAAGQVSPLAVSNVSSQRGAFVEALNKASSAPPSAPSSRPSAGSMPVASGAPSADDSSSFVKRNPIPGTEMMPSIAQPSAAASSGSPPTPSKNQGKTQLLGAFPQGSVPRPAGSAAPMGPMPASVAPGHHPSGAPSASPSGAPAAPSPSGAPVLHQPSTQPPIQPVQPVQPAVAPWNQAGGAYAAPGQPPVAPYGQAAPYAPPPPPPPPHAGYGFAYNPGARVTVTWSNGQRYPGTVQQVSGTQCLVAFPDGQHHWVEMQYVAPG